MDRVSAGRVSRDGLRRHRPDRKREGGVRRWFQLPLLRDDWRTADGRDSGRPVLVVRMRTEGPDRPRVPVALGAAKSDPVVCGRRRRPVLVLYEKIRAPRLVSTLYYAVFSGGVVSANALGTHSFRFSRPRHEFDSGMCTLVGGRRTTKTARLPKTNRYNLRPLGESTGMKPSA